MLTIAGFLPSSAGFVAAAGFAAELEVPAAGAFETVGATAGLTRAAVTLVEVEAKREALGEGLRTAVTPMARALAQAEYCDASSRICCCFSSSLARIYNESSGIIWFN
jgi:hypothetical protein